VNRRLLGALEGVDGVTVDDLYEKYPDLMVDAKREQALLVEHDVVVMQHPFYWYSTPGILKDWQDIVLEHGWAYGTDATALKGKILFNVVTTGAPMSAYSEGGRNRYTMRQLLAPIELTAGLCGMRFLPPFVVHSALTLGTDDDVGPYIQDYRRLIEALRDDKIDLEQAAKAEGLNDIARRMRQ